MLKFTSCFQYFYLLCGVSIFKILNVRSFVNYIFTEYEIFHQGERV